MSHFTTIKTVIRDQVMLEETLRELHHNFQTGERLPIRGYEAQNQYGQVVVNTGSEYDIGFQHQADRSFSVCADWWGVEGNTEVKEKSFLQELNQKYAHVSVKNQVEEHGYIIEEEKIHENGEIEMVICEMI